MIVAYAKGISDFGRTDKLYIVDCETEEKRVIGIEETRRLLSGCNKIYGVTLKVNGIASKIRVTDKIPYLFDSQLAHRPDVFVLKQIKGKDDQYRIISNEGRFATVNYSQLLGLYQSGRLLNMKLNGNSGKLCLIKGTLPII